MKETKDITYKRLSAVKSKNTSIEIFLRKKLFSLGYRYRIHDRRIFGKPDLVFPRQKLVIFCDSNFWHGYRFQRNCFKRNGKFWENKILGNIKRDKIVSNKLRKEGWKVLRFWEHQIYKNPDYCIRRIEENLADE